MTPRGPNYMQYIYNEFAVNISKFLEDVHVETLVWENKAHLIKKQPCSTVKKEGYNSVFFFHRIYMNSYA